MNIYYGEKNCQSLVCSTNKPCINKAYYKVNDKLLCGVHARKYDNLIKLPKNPNKKKIYQDKIKQMKIEVSKFAQDNKIKGLKGKVLVSKMKMMKSPTYIKGYLNIFPNYKHQNRKDGYGCMKLSPKSLGPINHNMPCLPVSLNLENFHQFAKFWKFELDKNNKIIEKFKQNRIEAYQKNSPKRHKYNKSKLLKYNDNVIKPEFSVYYDKFGKEHRYGYIECRYFYCHFYEILAKKEPDFKKIKNMINNGVNINIQGFDGYNVTSDLWYHYNDITKPFGHELVLYTMFIEENTKKYPWNRYYKENKSIYYNVI